MSAFLLDWISRLAQISGDARHALYRAAHSHQWGFEDFADNVIGAAKVMPSIADVLTPFELAVVRRAWHSDFEQNAYFDQRTWQPSYKEGNLRYDNAGRYGWRYDSLLPSRAFEIPAWERPMSPRGRQGRGPLPPAVPAERPPGRDVTNAPRWLAEPQWRREPVAYGDYEDDLWRPYQPAPAVGGRRRAQSAPQRDRWRGDPLPEPDYRGSAPFGRYSGSPPWWHQSAWSPARRPAGAYELPVRDDAAWGPVPYDWAPSRW